MVRAVRIHENGGPEVMQLEDIALGAPEPLDLQVLSLKGSLFITRPTMLTYTATTDELRQSSADLFDKVLSGDVVVEINQRYALDDIQQAHRDLESRRTTGSTVILPG